MIRVVGTGEASDISRRNASIIIEDKSTILIDAGWTVPDVVMKLDRDYLDAVYITHLHADHVAGLARILLWMHEEGRRKPVEISIHESGIEKLKQIVYLSYPGLFEHDAFIEFRPLPLSGKIAGMDYELIPSVHSIPNYGIKLHGKRIIGYSGDGRTPDSQWEQWKGCNLLFHEAYLAADMPGHPYNRIHDSAEHVASMAAKLGIKTYLTHIWRKQRSRVKSMAEAWDNVEVAEDDMIL